MLYHIVKNILIPLIYLFFRPRMLGRENLPAEGKAVVYSNHTSLLDPIVLGCLMPRPIHFMAKQELFRFPGMNTFMRGLGAFPVKRGTADLSAIKTALKVLQEGKVFGIFPEGTRSKSGSLQTFSHGVASIALKSKAPVVPVVIQNGYRLFRPITIVIGRPMDLEGYYGKRTNTELLGNVSSDMANAIRELMANGETG